MLFYRRIKREDLGGLLLVNKGDGIMVEKITLMETYLIEHLRQAGFSDESIIEKVESGRAAEFQEVHENFDFTQLHALSDKIATLLTEGYEIKFLTFTGLVNLLQLMFHKEENVDYDVDEFIVSKLQLTEEQLKTLQQIVSANWQISTSNTGVTITPVHAPA